MDYSNANRRAYLFGILFLALIYLCAGFYPFHVKTFANKEQINGAVTLPGGAVQFCTPGIAYTESVPSWLSDAISTSRFEVSLELRTAYSRQHGTAFFTVSLDRLHRNLSIGQWAANLSVRIRTPYTNSNARPAYIVKHVFADRQWHQVDVRIKPGAIEVRVDGDTRITTAMPDQPLETWGPDYRIALGNEPSGDRPWLGEIRKAVVRIGDQSFDYLVRGALLYPERFTIKNYHAWKIVPFTDVQWLPTALRDWIVNLAGFVPFGWLVVVFRQPRQGALLATALSATVSITIEVGQLLIFNNRHPSTEDIIMNTLGGALGAWIAARSALSANVEKRRMKRQF